MYSEFRTEDLGNGYTLVEPPAGLLPHINKRTKIYADEDGNSQLTQQLWAAIFVLACLHRNNVPVVVEVSDDIGNSINSIRSAYCNLEDDDFKELVNEFLFSIARDQLKEWFDKIDDLCYITKKAEDTAKND